MASYFENPANGYREKATGGWTWLWALLFGPFYFLYKGAWPHAVVSFVLTIVIFSGTTKYLIVELVMWSAVAVVYAVAAYPIVRKTYRRAGWIDVGQDQPPRRRGEPPPLSANVAAPAIWMHDDRRV